VNNRYQLIGLLIVVGFSLISWIFRKLNEQAQKKRARDMIEQRKLEMLRTGRDPNEVAVSAEVSEQAERQREIAARREAQLAELRRRAQARQQGEASPPVAPPVGPSVATMRGPVLRIPGSTGPTVPPPLESRALRNTTPQGQVPIRPNQKREQQRPAKPVRMPKAQPVARAVDDDEEVTHRLVPDDVVGRRAMPVVSAVAPRTPEEWRRALIANEILSPPLALRVRDVALPF